jgi:hypothetical protein
MFWLNFTVNTSPRSVCEPVSCQSAFVAELDEYGSGVLGGALLHGEDGAWLAE